MISKKLPKLLKQIKQPSNIYQYRGFSNKLSIIETLTFEKMFPEIEIYDKYYVQDVYYEIGDIIKTDDIIMNIEYLYMRLNVYSPYNCIIKDIHLKQGDYLDKKDTPLVSIQRID